MSHRDRQELVHPARARQLPAHGVERRGPLLALARGVRLHPDARRQTTGHEADDQHHQEREQVTDVGDREREDGRHEEEVEGGDAQDGGHQRRPSTIACRDDDDPEQVHHDEVGELEERQRQPRDAARQGDDGDRPEVGRPVARNRAPADKRRRHALLALGADDVDVDVTAALDERVDDRADQDARPELPAGLAHDDLRHVAIVRERQDRVAHFVSREPYGLGAQLLGEPQRLGDPVAHLGREP